METAPLDRVPALRLSADRRSGPRFSLCLPARVRDRQSDSGPAITRDVSHSGSYIYLDPAQDLAEGARLELVLQLPAEITGDAPVSVLCQADVVRIDRGFSRRIGVAVRINSYEFCRE